MFSNSDNEGDCITHGPRWSAASLNHDSCKDEEDNIYIQENQPSHNSVSSASEVAGIEHTCHIQKHRHDSSLVNYEESIDQKLDPPPIASNLAILEQLQSEENLSIQKLTLGVLQDPKYKFMSDQQKAKQISDGIMSIRAQFETVKKLIMGNHTA